MNIKLPKLKKLTLMQRYSIYGIAFGALVFIAISITILKSLTPEKKQYKYPHVAFKDPVVTVVEADSGPDISAIIRAAENANLRSDMVVKVVRSENLYKRHKNFKGACYFSRDLQGCVNQLSKKHRDVFYYLSRTPTPGDMLLAHIFGVDAAVDIIQLDDGKSPDQIDSKIIALNPRIKSHSTVGEFRSHLNTVVQGR